MRENNKDKGIEELERKTELDFNSNTIKKQLQKLIKDGKNPIDLCIQKWEYILATEKWNIGECADACALCVDNNYDDENTDACNHCLLGLAGYGCLKNFSSFRCFVHADSDEKHIRFAHKMIDHLKRVKNGEKNIMSSKSEDVRSLRARLVNHLNYTKFVLLGIGFVPWLLGTGYLWFSQLYSYRSGTIGHESYDTGSQYLFYFGFIGTMAIIIALWCLCWYLWKEESD